MRTGIKRKRYRKAKFKSISKKKYLEMEDLEDYIVSQYKNRYLIKLKSEIE